MNITLNTTLAAGALTSLCGLSAIALPWGYTVPYNGTQGIYGSNIPQCGAIGVTCLLLLFYIIATIPLDPPPIWRPVGIAIFAVIGGGYFLSYGYGPGRSWTGYAGPWISILSLLFLLVVATTELHCAFIRQQKARRQ